MAAAGLIRLSDVRPASLVDQGMCVVGWLITRDLEKFGLPRKFPGVGFKVMLGVPHNAAASDARFTVSNALAQIHWLERGEPLENVIDRARGY